MSTQSKILHDGQDIIRFVNRVTKQEYLRAFARSSKIERERRKPGFGDMRCRVGRIEC